MYPSEWIAGAVSSNSIAFAFVRFRVPSSRLEAAHAARTSPQLVVWGALGPANKGSEQYPRTGRNPLMAAGMWWRLDRITRPATDMMAIPKQRRAHVAS